MKKLILFFLLLTTSIAYSLDSNIDLVQTKTSEGKSSGSNELGVYFKDYLPVARMRQHTYNFCGGGISYSWCSADKIGFSLRFDAVGSQVNKNYVYNWFAMNLTVGIFLQYPVNEWFAIQPELEYGVQINNVNSSRDANGTYYDQILMISSSFRFGPLDIQDSGFIFEAAPFYSMGFETDGISQAAGLRLGIIRRFGGKTAN